MYKIIKKIDQVESNPTFLDLKKAVENYEALIIQAALRNTGGNQKKAAELLRINRTTLIEKMRHRKTPEN